MAKRAIANREHSLYGKGPPRHAPRSSALVAIQITPRLYDRECGASRDEEHGVGYVPEESKIPTASGLRRVGSGGGLAQWAHSQWEVRLGEAGVGWWWVPLLSETRSWNHM